MLKNVSIKVKLIASFMLIAAIVVVVGAVGYTSTNAVNNLSNEIIFNHMSPIFDLITFVDSFQGNRVTFRNILLASTKVDMEKHLREMDEQQRRQETALASFATKTGDKDPDSLKLIDGLKESLAHYESARAKVIEVSMSGKFNEAIDMLFAPSFTAIADEVLLDLGNLKTQKGTIIRTLNERQVAIEESSRATIFSALGIGIAFSLILGISISLGISSQIKKILGIVKNVAAGDLTARIASDRRNELGELSNEVDSMADDLRYVISNVQDTAILVDDASKQVSSSSMSLAQISTQQASSAQEISASVTQIAAQTRTNAENATKATELSQATRREADKGREQMGEMLGAMSAINDASVSISNIIKVIEDIAFQTNILALNAAVEAARAGQHGKGFAVVAEEVRTLAARSAKAASETTDLIESAVREVANGSKIAGKTAESLNSVVDEITSAAELVSGISAASAEQSQGISQVNIGVDQVSQAIQTTSSVAEETASASSELSMHASTLKGLISGFKLDSAGAARGGPDGGEARMGGMAGAGGAGAMGRIGSAGGPGRHGATADTGASARRAGGSGARGAGIYDSYEDCGAGGTGSGAARLPAAAGTGAAADRRKRSIPNIDLGSSGFGKY
jgi:methyl-accepting chemotaxis protein